jgi:membrane fusion protein, copper/silver efflux system
MNMKKAGIVLGCLLTASSLLLLYGGLPAAQRAEQAAEMTAAPAHAAQRAVTKYICPMHPQVASAAPSKCPICGMDLVAAEHGHGGYPAEDAAGATAQDDSGRKVLYWYDPMMPGKKFDRPGKSPFMDMELVPKFADDTDGGTPGGKPVMGINAETVQKMGVRIEKVAKSTLDGGLRATGIVSENERTRRNIFSQIEGRVDELNASAQGDEVKKGDMFYTLYSPELLALQNDYLAASKAGEKTLAAAAARRMLLLGVDDRVVATLAKTGRAYDSVPFYIPADGILQQLDIRKGSYVKANDAVARIEDLSTVWVVAAIPEQDLGRMTEGDQAKVAVSGSLRELEATVDYIYPTIMPETRTGRVRLVVENPDRLLRPAAYATVTFNTGARETLTAPSSAILRDSSGEHVIVSLGDGRFQARKVKTGLAAEGRTEILGGLSAGEDVVTSGQFLIDSESSLRESLQKLSGGVP